MTLVAYSHKPIPVHAIQFDGSVGTLNAIYAALPPQANGVRVSIQFDGAGVAASVTFEGGLRLSLTPSDWLIVPDDSSRPPFVVPDAAFASDWQ